MKNFIAKVAVISGAGPGLVRALALHAGETNLSKRPRERRIWSRTRFGFALYQAVMYLVFCDLIPPELEETRLAPI